jgi:hypothetical protein
VNIEIILAHKGDRRDEILARKWDKVESKEKRYASVVGPMGPTYMRSKRHADKRGDQTSHGSGKQT